MKLVGFFAWRVIMGHWVRDDEVIRKLAEKWGSARDFTNAYITRNEKGLRYVTYWCNDHGGNVTQLVGNCLSNNFGCMICRGKWMTHDKLIEQFREANPAEDGRWPCGYDRVVYVNDKKKVEIECLRDPRHGVFKKSPSDHKQGKGCPKCGKRRMGPTKSSNWLHLITFEDFVTMAVEIYGDADGYDDVPRDMEFWSVDVPILCGTCSKVYLRRPREYLIERKGCPDCRIDPRVLPHHVWVERLRAVKGNQFDYTHSVFGATADKFTGHCFKHNGPFTMTLADHYYNGSGCPVCAGVVWNDDYIIKEGERLHVDENGVPLYGYWKVRDVKSKKDDITLWCKYHREYFTVGCEGHIHPVRKYGCKKCGNHRSVAHHYRTPAHKATLLASVHGDFHYDWSNTKWGNAFKKIKVGCNVHEKEFPTTYRDHFHRKSGCPDCAILRAGANQSGVSEQVAHIRSLFPIKSQEDLEYLRGLVRSGITRPSQITLPASQSDLSFSSNEPKSEAFYLKS
jgi:hypothetical protein